MSSSERQPTNKKRATLLVALSMALCGCIALPGNSADDASAGTPHLFRALSTSLPSTGNANKYPHESDSARSFPSPLNPNKRLVTLTAPESARGAQVWVHDAKECAFISGSLLQKGSWEPNLQEELLRAMPSDGTSGFFVDIGANIGTFSLVMAASGHQVASFEPMPYNTELFRASIVENRLWNKIDLYDAAVGADPADEVCLAPAAGGQPTKNQGNGQIQTSPTAGATCVPLIRPDSVLNGRCPDALKVDVEGYEAPAMRGLGIADGTCLPKVIVHEYNAKYAIENPFEVLGDNYVCNYVNWKKSIPNSADEHPSGDYVCKLRDFALAAAS